MKFDVDDSDELDEKRIKLGILVGDDTHIEEGVVDEAEMRGYTGVTNKYYVTQQIDYVHTDSDSVDKSKVVLQLNKEFEIRRWSILTAVEGLYVLPIR